MNAEPGRAAARASPGAAPSGRSGAWADGARRTIDLVVALLVLVLGLPLLVLVSAWVRLDSPGPALLRQLRVGRGQRTFTLYKFRSMIVSGDDSAHRQLIAAELRGEVVAHDGSTKLNDPRVTRAGAFLRRTSLDEVPQLLNVLLGHMSLVGPRPCLPWEADLFPPEFAERFTVRPGLTGLWQIGGRSTMGTLDMLRLDLDYVRGRGLRVDLYILACTLPSLLRGDGAR